MRRFSQVDVFSDGLGFGNAVAVVHDADGLTDEEMARFARWTQLSETTFLLEPDDAAADYRMRIWTTSAELPFAGHPTLGSARAWLAAGHESRTGERVVQQCGIGLVTLESHGPRLGFMAPPLLRSGPVDEADVTRISAGLGLRPEQVVAAQWADNGPGWVALLLTDAESVLDVEPRAAGLRAGDMVGVVGPHRAGGAADFEVRAFFAGGIGEDPVTGSLNAALAQWLIPAGLAPASYVVAQGTRLGRRGRVYIDSGSDGQAVWVGGDTVVAISGTVDL
jgi:PhzF family phenazine biosynthesis protein